MTYFIYLQISWAALAAVSALVLFIPLQGVFAKSFGKIRRFASNFRDERIKTLSDMFTGILVIKLYGWERPFMKKILELRSLELDFIKRANYIKAFNDAIFFSSSTIISLIAFITYIYMGQVLTPQKVFVTMVLLQNVRLDMTNFFPKAVQSLAESLVSIRRIQNFLNMSTVNSKRDFRYAIKELDNMSSDSTKPLMISIQNASFSWYEKFEFNSNSHIDLPTVADDNDTDRLVLNNISLDLSMGQLLGVCGIVGSGKSSLLIGILGELQPVQGSVLIRNKEIGYVGQSPWILSGSIKDNILFGKEYKQDWFMTVVKHCGLDEDFDRLPDHENTIIGERGVTLSGGQKARVALARAIYLDADIYLLDDPLSAVDAKVGRFIFDQCIRGIMKEKCIILVSHQLQYIKNCDKVALIEKGRLLGCGMFEEVMHTESSDFAATMRDFANEPFKINEFVKKEEQDNLVEAAIEMEQPTRNNDNAIISDETVKKGAVTFSIYFKYLKADLPYILLILLLLSLILGETLLVYASYWLAYISQQSAQIQAELRNQNVYTYISVVLVGIFFSVVRAVWFYLNCIRSGRLIFSQMLISVFRAPLDFFNINPHGRIMK